MIAAAADNNNNHNNEGISALGLDRDMGFSRGHQGCQGHRLHSDDNNEVEDSDKDDDNNKDDNNDKGISALGLDRDLGTVINQEVGHHNTA